MKERLKILLCIAPAADARSLNHGFVSDLAHALCETVDAEYDVIGSSTVQKKLKDYHLIHVFGCRQSAVLKLLHKTYRLHIPTILSPIGDLQPWMQRQPKGHLLRRWQQRAVRTASAIHLWSTVEYECFSKLQWNSRAEFIINPNVTNRITFQEAAEKFVLLYRKVLDTQARLLLTEAAQTAIGQLLELGVDEATLSDKSHCQSLKERLTVLTGEDWHQIMIYAADEHILDAVRMGLQRIQHEIPEIVPSDITRFPLLSTYAGDTLNTVELLPGAVSDSEKFLRFFHDNEMRERQLCIALANLRHENAHRTAPLSHLADIYVLLRFSEMDEDRLKEAVAVLGLQHFAERLMTVLHKVLRLSEGFMPFQARPDKTADKLLLQFTKFNCWA